jgi:hypothetical protein
LYSKIEDKQSKGESMFEKLSIERTKREREALIRESDSTQMRSKNNKETGRSPSFWSRLLEKLSGFLDLNNHGSAP